MDNFALHDTPIWHDPVTAARPSRGGTGLRTWATNSMLYATAANVWGTVAPANSSVLISSGGGVPSWSTTVPAVSLGSGTTVTAPSANDNSTKIVSSAWTITQIVQAVGAYLTTGGANDPNSAAPNVEGVTVDRPHSRAAMVYAYGYNPGAVLNQVRSSF